MTPGISWLTLALLATSGGAAAHALPDGRLPAVITPRHAGLTGRAKQKAARDAARKKRK